MRQPDTTSSRASPYSGSFAPRGRVNTRTLIYAALIGLALLTSTWMALAAAALWQFAESVDELVEPIPPPAAPPPSFDVGGLEAPRPPALPPSSPALPDPLPSRRSDEGSAMSTSESVDESAEVSSSATPTGLEYHGAVCSGVFVYIVTVVEQAPRRSAVSFATSSAARSTFARPGDSVGPFEVLAITDDWSGANPAVWLVQNDEVCRTGLTGNPARIKAARAEQLRKEAARKRKRMRKRKRKRRRRR